MTDKIKDKRQKYENKIDSRRTAQGIGLSTIRPHDSIFIIDMSTQNGISL